MPEPAMICVEAFPDFIGKEVGVSRWFTVAQARINAFAEVTEDHQFIHVDPERAASTPFGGTIAHGFLTLGLLAPMSQDALPKVERSVMGVNYGFDQIRFLAPVRSGARIRGRFVLAAADLKGTDRWLLKHTVTVEIENEAKPALIADWLSMRIIGRPA
jgi:acyl dehydratase